MNYGVSQLLQLLINKKIILKITSIAGTHLSWTHTAAILPEGNCPCRFSIQLKNSESGIGWIMARILSSNTVARHF
eukprot:c40248_g1_i1 orf=67-294(+)